MVNLNWIYFANKKNCEKSHTVFSHYIARVNPYQKKIELRQRKIKSFSIKEIKKCIKTKKLKKSSVRLNLNWTNQHKQ